MNYLSGSGFYKESRTCSAKQNTSSQHLPFVLPCLSFCSSHCPDVFIRTKGNILISQPRQFRAGESPKSAYFKIYMILSACFRSPSVWPSLYIQLRQDPSHSTLPQPFLGQKNLTLVHFPATFVLTHNS